MHNTILSSLLWNSPNSLYRRCQLINVASSIVRSRIRDTIWLPFSTNLYAGWPQGFMKERWEVDLAGKPHELQSGAHNVKACLSRAKIAYSTSLGCWQGFGV